MTIYYIDSRATGANDGDPDGATGPDGDGIYQDAWQSIAAAEAAKPYIGGDEVRFVVGSGPYREKLSMGKNGVSGTPVLWRTTVIGQKVEISAGDDMNDSAYQWTASAGGTNEYYLELSGGGDPLLTQVKSATVGGYYRGSSAEPMRQRQAPGALDNRSFGWGDNDSLGYSTLYVRTEGGSPDLVEVIASQRPNITDVNWRDHDFEDLVFSYGNDECVDPRGQRFVYRRCAFIFPDFTGLFTASTDPLSGATCISCVYYWAGHRVAAIEGAGAGKISLYNCTDYGAHIFGLLNSSAGANITAVNCISLHGEAGVFDRKQTAGTLTESNNLWFPRMNASGGDLGYVSATNWAETDKSDTPPGTSTNKNALGATLGRDAYPNLKDPQLSGIQENSFGSSDFRPKATSPAVGAGVDWWTAIGEAAPLAYDGTAVDIDNIHLGAMQTLIRVPGGAFGSAITKGSVG